MRNLIAASIVLCGLGSSLAYGESPPSRWHGVFSVPIVTCYTKEAINQLVAASKKNNAAAELKKLSKSCEISNPGTIFGVLDSSDEGLTYGANGRTLHAWVIHGGKVDITGKKVNIKEVWFLYPEKYKHEIDV